jgi:ATP-dependent Zn protease
MTKPVGERMRPFSTAIVVLATTLLVLWVMRGTLLGSEAKQIAYSELVTAIEQGRMKDAQLRPNEIGATLRGKNGASDEAVVTERIPNMDERALLEAMERHGVVVTGQPERTSLWSSLLFGVLPFLVLPLLSSGALRRSRREPWVRDGR